MEEGVTVVREALRELVTDYMQMSVVEDIVEELVKGEMSDLVSAPHLFFSCYRAQSIVDFLIGGHVNIVSDYKET